MAKIKPVNKATGTFGENPYWRQQWADQYSALNPTWSSSPEANAVLPHPIVGVKFDPMLDPSYAGAYSNVTGANERAQAERGYQGHVYGQQYGYDQNGNLITSGADLNPYAQAAVMKRNYDISTKGTQTSYANRNDLFSSAYGNAQAANQFNYGLSSDQLQRAAQAAYHNANLSVQNTADAGQAQLASLLPQAFAAFLAGQQKGS
jgi:hypothetical protein